jgi:hypothetical protein
MVQVENPEHVAYEAPVAVRINNTAGGKFGITATSCLSTGCRFSKSLYYLLLYVHNFVESSHANRGAEKDRPTTDP